MRKIAKLDESTIRLIAAGEVIERPASLVKELVENSADAEAKNITISVDNYGLGKIRVFDDGIGMAKDDAILALERHTTSKISSGEDLMFIDTFGFRGEALWAISSVSKVIMRTRTEDDEMGTEVLAEGGKVVGVREIGCDKGTQVVVSDLFFNAPVRRKFLRSSKTEYSHIVNVVSRYALSLLDVNLRFLHNGEEVFFFPAGRSIEDTLMGIAGMSVDFRNFSHDTGAITVRAWVSKEKVGLGLFIFVNGRFVKDRLITSAIREEMGYVEGAIFLDCPLYMFDVNVHPAKIEIKWRAPSMIVKVVKEAFKRHPKPQVEQVSFAQKGGKILGVVGGFAVLDGGDEIVIVDVHAAHESRVYRELSRSMKSGKPVSYELLLPEEITLPEEKSALFKDSLDILKDFGFDIRYTKGKFIVYSIPEILLGSDLREILFEVAELIEHEGMKLAFETLIDKMAARIACKSSARLGDRIAIEGVEEIVKGMGERCPHGRPTAIRITLDRLKKLFGR